MAAAIKLIIRDGRTGREGGEAGIGDGRGAILETREIDAPVDLGDVLQLNDGANVQVIGITENITGTSWEQDAAIGNLP